MIKALFIGHLGQDAKTNSVNGKTVINFSACHTEKWKDATGKENEKQIWLDCSYWTEKTVIAQYLTKGTQVFLEGTPDIRTYQKQDGSTGASMTLKVGLVQLLGSKQQNTAPAPTAQPAPNNQPLDDLPF